MMSWSGNKWVLAIAIVVCFLILVDLAFTETQTSTVIEQDLEVIITSKQGIPSAELIRIGDQYYECHNNKCRIRVELTGVFWNGSDLQELVERGVSQEVDSSFADMQAWMKETALPKQEELGNLTKKYEECAAGRQVYDAELNRRDERIQQLKDTIYAQHVNFKNVEGFAKLAIYIIVFGILIRETHGAPWFKGATKRVKETFMR